MKRRPPNPSAARISAELDFQHPTSRRDEVRGKASTTRGKLGNPTTESMTRARVKRVSKAKACD
jgi:hypothetical protein